MSIFSHKTATASEIAEMFGDRYTPAGHWRYCQKCDKLKFDEGYGAGIDPLYLCQCQPQKGRE